MTTESSARPIRFLLVEDDESHAELVRRAMSSGRIANDLTHVTDGEQALALLRAEPPFEGHPRPDVILLDLKLPKVTGMDVLDAIKDDAQLSTIPVVVLTTSDEESDRTRAYAGNANSYVVKPLQFNRFNQMVQDLQLYWAVWNRPASLDED